MNETYVKATCPRCKKEMASTLLDGHIDACVKEKGLMTATEANEAVSRPNGETAVSQKQALKKTVEVKKVTKNKKTPKTEEPKVEKPAKTNTTPEAPTEVKTNNKKAKKQKNEAKPSNDKKSQTTKKIVELLTTAGEKGLEFQEIVSSTGKSVRCLRTLIYNGVHSGKWKSVEQKDSNRARYVLNGSTAKAKTKAANVKNGSKITAVKAKNGSKKKTAQ